MSLDLTQYLVSNSVINGVRAADSLFCAGNGEAEKEKCNDQAYMNALIDAINEQTSRFQLENTRLLLEWALSRR